MFLRNTVFPRDAVNPKGEFRPNFGAVAMRAVGLRLGDVPVDAKNAVGFTPAIGMQTAITAAGFSKLSGISTGDWRAKGAFSCGVAGGFTLKMSEHGRWRLKHEACWRTGFVVASMSSTVRRLFFVGGCFARHFPLLPGWYVVSQMGFSWASGTYK